MAGMGTIARPRIKGPQRFEIMLQKQGSCLDLSDITNKPNGLMTFLLIGDYVVRQNTLLLQAWGGGQQCRLYQGTLLGFEGGSVPIRLLTGE